MKFLFIALGLLSVLIGAIGAFLPILPTTPFLLLGSYFLAKGSDKFNNWLKGTKLYKDNLQNYNENKSMTWKTKIYLMILSSSMIWLSVFLVDKSYLKAMLIGIDMFKYYYFIFVIKTQVKFEKED